MDSKVFILVNVSFLFLFASELHADYGVPVPQPIQKIGSCPNYYSPSNEYCVPMANAPFVVLKDGPCPSYYSSSGSYCIALKGAKYIIPKQGSVCPTGWSSSNNYCIPLK